MKLSEGKSSMENVENEQVVRWMKALVDSMCDLSCLAAKFRALPDVEKVDADIYVHRIINPAGVEVPYYGFAYYVEVLLRNDNEVCWHMDVSWNEAKWVIETFVSIPGKDCSETIKEFPNRFAHSVDEFIVELTAGTKQLVGCADLIETQRSK
jgi:hypothetical protein